MLQALESWFVPCFYNDYLSKFKLTVLCSSSDKRELWMITYQSLSIYLIGLWASLNLLSWVASYKNSFSSSVAKSRRCNRYHYHKPSPSPSYRKTSFTTNRFLLPSPSAPLELPTATSSPPLPTLPKFLVKCLLVEELANHRDRGLCYHCDEKWVTGHQCKPRLHLFIAYD